MNSVILLLFVSSFQLASCNFCNSFASSATVLPELGYSEVLAIRNGAGKRTSLLISNSVSSSLTTPANSNNQFETGASSHKVHGPSYCHQLGDEMASADISGNRRDDLVCRRSDGSFAFRARSGNTFEGKIRVLKDFNCPATDAIYFGDFDGNKATDIMCVNVLRDTYRIYFRSPCNRDKLVVQKYGYGAGRAYPNPHPKRSFKSYHHQRSYNKYGCKDNLPKVHQIDDPGVIICPPGAAPYANIHIGDVNGDGKDDIICHVSALEITYSLSTCSLSNTLFNAPVATGLVCNLATHVLLVGNVLLGTLPADELICVDKEASAATALASVASVITASGPLLFVPATVPASGGGPCVNFCQDATAVAGTTIFRVGDFNGDGKDDLMCRFLSTTNNPNTWTTIIHFSQG